VKKGNCKICGDSHKDTRIYEHDSEGTLCRKHYIQYNRYGEYYDRTIYDDNEINIEGDVATIKLYDAKGNVRGQTIIDKEDVEKIENVKVYMDNSGYARVSLQKGKKEFLHQFISDIDGFIDHKNQDKLDNRKENLRPADHQKNAYNVDKGLFKGVKEVREGRYTASIMHNYDSYHLGTFSDKKEALYARDIADKFFCPKYRDKNYDNKKSKVFERIKISDREDIKMEVLRQIKKLKKRHDNNTDK